MTEGLLSPVPVSIRSPLFFFRPDMNSSVVIFFTTSNSLYPQVCLRTYSTSFISARLVTCAVISVHSFGSLKKLASGLLKPSNVWPDSDCIEKRGLDKPEEGLLRFIYFLCKSKAVSIDSHRS